jgi:hypothetical protein
MAAPCFVTTLRHPLEVIMSKQTYYGGPWNPNNRVAGWLNTMLYTERATRGNRRAFVHYEDLLSDWMRALAQVCDALDLALLERADPTQMRAAARLVDPSLRRATATWSSLGVDDRLVELAEETWGTFDHAMRVDAPDDASTRAEFDRLREGYVALYSFAESLAQSSVSAAQRDGRSGRRAAGLSGTGRPATRRLLRRVKRRARQTIYRIRSGNRRPTTEEALPKSTPSAGPPER